MNTAITTIEELTADIPLTNLVKRTLHEIAPADRNQIANHLGLHKDDRDHISKAINALNRNGEVRRANGDASPAKWITIGHKKHQAPNVGHAPPSAQSTSQRKTPTQPTATTTEKNPASTRSSATVTNVAASNPNSKPAAPTDHETTIHQQLTELEQRLNHPPQTIRNRPLKSAALERLAGMFNNEIADLLLEINRDLHTADGSIPAASYTGATP